MTSFHNDLFKVVSFKPSSLHAPDSWCGHLPFAAWLIQTLKPNLFVELGTHTGNSYFSFCQSIKENKLDTKCYAVDTWQGDEHAGKYNDEIFQQVTAYNEEHYACFSRLLRTQFDDAVNYFSDGSIQLLHIDGLHTYEAVRHDFETWLPKLAPNAIILFHDTNVRERGFGVWKLWEELIARYPRNLEFLHSHGLGVLQLDSITNISRFDWLVPGSQEQHQVKEIFASLGERQLERFKYKQIKAQSNDLIGEIGNLKQAVNEREKQISHINQILIQREKQVSDINQVLIERDKQISSLSQALGSLDTQIRGLHDSTSWRLTSPLRFVGHQIKRGQRCVELLKPAVNSAGGLRSAIKKAVRIYQREGFEGIKRGFRLVAQHNNATAEEGLNGVHRNDYDEWVLRYDTLSEERRANIRSHLKTFRQKPLISVVMPTYNSKPQWLIEAIESVRKQLYPNWELCIADDASTDEETRSILKRYAKNDPRIKVVFREENGHISVASNSALSLATGIWVALLDHDDVLTEHALYHVVEAINQQPDVQLIYSDEDKINKDGNRFDPYFKCDWNVDLFYSHNLICHLAVYRADLLNTIGGFREGFEGAQDYDLALRFIEKIKPHQIFHIPRVLYHWRVHSESTAQSAEAKPYALNAGEKALNEHFQRQKINAKVELVSEGYRVRYALPDVLPMVSLIIPTRNGLHLIRQCIESILRKTTYPNYEIIIVDNSSDDAETLRYFDELRTESRVRILRDDCPFNYSALNNAAVRLARGEVLGLINNDIEVISEEWLSEMVSIALQEKVGAVGARLWYPDNTLQHGGVILGIGGVAGHSHKYLSQKEFGYFSRAKLIQGFSVVTAACLIIKKSIYEEVGGLNENELKIAFNDIDFCLRIREAGFRNVWTPYAELYHYESATRGYEDTLEKQLRFQSEVLYMQKRWGNLLLEDPAYSPNLTLDHEDFSFAWPPRTTCTSKNVVPKAA